jgi:hypothetical protein
MAAIASITNGEAMSSVRTKLNTVITEVNLLDPTDWIDYSATSTIVGWSSTTTKIIRYRIIGKQIFVSYFIIGTSNSTSTTFTIPNNCNIISTAFTTYATNNGVNQGITYATASAASNVITFYSSLIGAAWTASGSKAIRGNFFIEID